MLVALLYWSFYSDSMIGIPEIECRLISPITSTTGSLYASVISGFGFRVSGFGFRVPESGFRVLDPGRCLTSKEPSGPRLIPSAAENQGLPLTTVNNG